MATIHQEIDNWLAADLFGELSDTERHAFHSHLIDCEDCRRLHQQNKIMDKVLNETLSSEKPEPRFEHRMLAGFRNRIPLRRGGIGNFITDLARMKWARVAVVILILVLLIPFGAVTRMSMRGPMSTPVETRLMEASTGSEAERNLAIAQARYDRQSHLNIRPQERVGGYVASAPAAPPPAPTPNPFNPFNQIISGGGRARLAEFGNRTFDNTSNAPSVFAESGPNPTLALNRDLIEKSGSRTADRGDIATAEGAASVIASTVASGTPKSDAASANESTTLALANRKLIRNASVDIEVVSFDESLQKITALAQQAGGYIATTSSEKQANGKLRGEIVVKVVPENLDRFLHGVRGLGDLKNQTLGTEDITKQYFDTDARLKNSRVMEQRLLDMLKKKSDDINDLLQVEKELGRVREAIEKMQGELKFWDSQVQFATVTVNLAEKDLEEPAAFLLKERAQLALYSPEVEKIYNDIKALASPKVQITNAQLDRDNTGRISARVNLLVVPEESDDTIGKVKAMGRVENFQVQTDRIAQGGNGMSENAKTKRDKVELNITISRDEQEQALQQTTLRIRTGSVDERTRALRDLAEKQGGRVRSSSFSRDPNGREFADVSLRIPMKNYSTLMQSLNSLGKVEDVSVQRQDRPNTLTDEANAPADISIQIYSQGNLVSQDSGLFATLRHTIGEGAAALMWSLRMIGVALAFLLPWAAALTAVVWVTKRLRRARNR